MSLEIRPGLSSKNLPENFVPVSLFKGTSDRLLISENNGTISVQTIAGNNLTEPSANYWENLTTQNGNLYIGPFTASDIVALPRGGAAGFAPPDPDQPTIAIIDTGIAFWNPKFGGRVKQITFLGGRTNKDKGILDEDEIKDLSGTTAQPDGVSNLFQYLADRFPDSIYARGLHPQSFSHGTAMADLASRERENPIIGVELPATALFDRTGDTLTGLLLAAVQAAITGFLSWIGHNDPSRYPLHIVLAYGFTGGPHDGNHPAVRILDQILRNFRQRETALDVKLFLPVGNALQDKVCVDLGDISQNNRNNRQGFNWDIPPDDYSQNTFELVCKSNHYPYLEVTTPSGDTAHTADPDHIGELIFDKNVIGNIELKVSAGNWRRYRLTLAPSVHLPGYFAATPHGRWKIAIVAEGNDVSDIQAWILRDDHPELKDPIGKHRQSQFFDPAYKEKGLDGAWILDDLGNNSAIKREGTASVLSTATADGILTFEALHDRGGAGKSRAWYSALPKSGNSVSGDVIVEKGWPANGVSALGNGTKRKFRVSGTSVAAALAAGR